MQQLEQEQAKSAQLERSSELSSVQEHQDRVHDLGAVAVAAAIESDDDVQRKL